MISARQIRREHSRILVTNKYLRRSSPPMAESAHNPLEQQDSFFIIGRTSNGRQFRPSDWAERLCGVMSVVVNGKLRDLEPMAYHFVISFAKDNDLQMVDACILPDKT